MAAEATQKKDGFFSRLNPFRKSFSYSNVPTRGGGWWTISEPFSGAWQRNIEWKRETVMANHAVFACITLIASDISKLRIGMSRVDSDGIWVQVPLGDYRVLEKPNSYQTRIQFFENWINSKLSRGNAYILKNRDSRGRVTSLHVLNPDLVLPLVSDDGEVFYQLAADDLTNVGTGITVPASEIIHDRFNCLFHPLVGLSPIFACGLAAYGGIKIQESSARLFKNGARPVGILTAPGAISPETATALKESWEANYGGENYGRTAVLGDDLKYTPITHNAEQSQLIEQLRLSAEMICSTFHVPRYKVIGEMPSFNNVEAFEQQYYSQCLQVLIESIELLLDEGLEVRDGMGTEFDLEGLLRMDTKTQIESLAAGVKGSIMTPNYALRKLNQKPIRGGDTIWMQQQNYSLEALDERDRSGDPFGTKTEETTEPPQDDAQKDLMSLALMLRKELGEVKYDA